MEKVKLSNILLKIWMIVLGAEIFSGCGFSAPKNQPSSATVLPSAPCLSQPPSIVSWWDGSSVSSLTAIDRIGSPNGNNGIMNNVSSVVGKFGNAFQLDGSSSAISMNSTNSLSPTTAMTIMAWVNSNLGSRNSASFQTLLTKSSLQTNPFSQSSSWQGVDIAGSSALNNTSYRGYRSAVFDGRYLYFIPYFNAASSPHGYVARFDTQASSLTAAGSWDGVDIAGLGGNASDGTPWANFVGFSGGVFDGRYIYFIPNNSTTNDNYVFNGQGGNANIAVYDTHAGFTTASSWQGINISNLGGNATDGSAWTNFSGFSGGIFDGKYVYLVPWFNSTYHGYMARYDTTRPLATVSSWSGVNIAGTSALNNAQYTGFFGGAYDGHYIYFSPLHSSFLARFNTQGAINSTLSWSGVDITSANALNSSSYANYAGAITDGQFIYFVPLGTGASASGYLARYDKTQSLTSPSAWNGTDIKSMCGNLAWAGFVGGYYDGRYIYFVPYYQGGPNDSVARYDTQAPFSATSSWSCTHITTAVNDTNTYSGFFGAAFDGKYLYFVPYKNSSFDGRLVRYDVLGSNSSYTLMYSNVLGDGISASNPGVSFTTQTTNGPNSVYSQSALTANIWNHVAATYDGSNLSVYQNGILAASQSTNGSIKMSTSNVTLGGMSEGREYFKGMIDDLQIFSAALTAYDIRAYYQSASLYCH